MPDTSTSQSPPSDTRGTTGRLDGMALGSLSIVVFSDILCPWAHIGVSRLLRSRHDRGLDGEIAIEHRAFPLEVVGDRPHDRHHFDQMVDALRDVEPDAGWSRWAGPDDDFPASSLLALEAVQAAKAVSPQASAALDRALRRAVFADSRPIDQLETVMAVAREVDDIDDVRAFETELRSGRPRQEVDEQAACAGTDEIPSSPTVVLPDGSTLVNPGIEFHTEDDVPVIDVDDASAYDRLLESYLEQRTYD